MPKLTLQTLRKRAAIENKNVLLQIGGNWCLWRVRFNSLVSQDHDLNKYLRANYVVVHVNYSKENTNDKLMAQLGFPQRFGFPVFVVLDRKGNRLDIQNSEYLEEGKGPQQRKSDGIFKELVAGRAGPKELREGGKINCLKGQAFACLRQAQSTASLHLKSAGKSRGDVIKLAQKMERFILLTLSTL